MAGREPSTTRRRVLGAAVALPVLALAPPAVRPEPVEGSPFSPEHRKACTLWNRRLARYRRLDAEWMAHPYAGTKPSVPDYERLRAEQEVLGRRAWRALRLVLRTAAPDHAAFVEKLEVVDLEFGDCMDGHFVHLVDDARRLGRAG